MRVMLIAVGRRMPAWVDDGFREYAGRLTRGIVLELAEVNAGSRSGGADPSRAVRDEGARITARIPQDAHVVALDERGERWSTHELAAQVSAWRDAARPVALVVGGPDGLDATVAERAHQSWSLSPLTLPHALVRIVIAEQLYRAAAILANHPYHRA